MYQRTLSAPPRIAREGWVPAGPEKGVNKRHMRIPKTGGSPYNYIPTIMDLTDGPREREVLREICETGDLIQQNGHTYLVARVSSHTVDTLATFESEREDLEVEPDAEQVDEDRDDSDLEPDHDEEYDFPRERQKYVLAAKKRQIRGMRP